jgi:hypothetical protein
MGSRDRGRRERGKPELATQLRDALDWLQTGDGGLRCRPMDGGLAEGDDPPRWPPAGTVDPAWGVDCCTGLHIGLSSLTMEESDREWVG